MRPPDLAALHRAFAAQAGAEQIATEFAMRGLWRWLCRVQLEKILEVGTGIGTLTSLLADYAMRSGAHLVTVEDDDWCRAQAQAHLKGLGEHATFLARIPDECFDFVVVDGPQIRAADWRVLSAGGTAFFEGNRRGQRFDLHHELCGVRADPPSTMVEANWRPPDRTKGYWLIRTMPSVAERAWFAAVRVREWCLDLAPRWGRRPIGKRAVPKKFT